MGRILEQKISRFDGGISDDPRSNSPNAGAMVKHFDVFSNPFKLSPYRSMKAEQTAVSVADLKNYDIRDFQLGSNGQMYALGRIAANNYPKILSKADPTTGNWTLPATAQATGTPVRINGCFIEWQSAFLLFSGTTNISRWVIGGAFTDAFGTVGSTITTVAQGLIFGDNLFLPYNNKIAKITSAGVVTDAVTPALPSDMRITSLARWGNYIMIVMAYGTSATASPTGRSTMYQWDGSSTTVFNDVIDLGEGAALVAGNIEGRIVVVSNKYLETPSGLTSLAVGGGSMVIRLWAGGTPQVMKELVGNQVVTLGRFIQNVIVKNNKMYWVASVPLNQSTSTESTYHLGVWVFGRKNISSNFALSLDYVANAVVSSSNFYINSFGAAGNYWFLNHSADFSIHMTDDTANFTETSIYESPILNLSESSITKKLLGVTVDMVALPSGGQAVLKYRKDEETAYTTIFTYTTANGISHSAINIESSGATLPEFKELQLRVESTGNAEITGIRFKAETIDKDLY